MILVVNLNPAVDVNVFGEKFRVYAENRGAACFPEPGGKGNNAARVANLLGGDVIATGLLGGFTGKFIEEELKKEGVVTDFLPITGTTRITLSHIETDSARETKIVPHSPELAPGAAEEFCAHLDLLLEKHNFSIAAFCGSLPPDLKPDYYVKLMHVAGKHGVPVVIDTSGQPLTEAVRLRPYMIKPNQYEAREFTGKDKTNDIFQIFKKLSGKISIICYSMGEDGAAFFSGGKVTRVYSPIRDAAVNPVGAGDALVGGFLAAFDRFGNNRDILYRWAVAAGTSTAMSPGLLWDNTLFKNVLDGLITDEG